MLSAIPEHHLELAILGPDARAMMPDRGERRRLVARAVSRKAGLDGANAEDGVFAWKRLPAGAERTGAVALPAGRLRVAALLNRERMRAAAAGKGTCGGATCAPRLQKGLRFLQDVCHLPIEADTDLAEAAAEWDNPLQQATPRRHAASLPLVIQMQCEHVASYGTNAVGRAVARAFLVAAFAHNTRVNDALNATLWSIESDPMVVRGITTVRSKDGLPLYLYAPAEGYLGPYGWWPEHDRLMRDRGHALPDFHAGAAAGPFAVTGLLPGVMPAGKALPALRRICAEPPLRMSASEFDALGIKGHSIHGTGADMARFLGEAGGFADADSRRLGHWRRDKNAAHELPGPGARTAPPGAPNARATMEHRYTQGVGRRGEEAEQLRVRSRLVQAVRDGLARWGKPWHITLPRDLSSWVALLPGAGAALGAGASNAVGATARACNLGARLSDSVGMEGAPRPIPDPMRVREIALGRHPQN